MSLFDDLVSINNSLSATLQGINSLLPFEAETLKDAPPIIEVAIGSARQEGEESGYGTGYDDGYGAAESFIVHQSNEAITKYTTPAEDWSELPSKIDEVYEAGKAAGGGYDDYYDTFWDVFQQNGKKTSYAYAFYHISWNDSNFKPKYDIKPENAQDMFTWSQITDMVGILQRQGVTLDFSGCASMLRTFNNFNKCTRLGVLDISHATDVRNMCTGCSALVSIDEVVFSETTGSSYNNTAMFQNCSALVEVRASGTIPFSIDLHWSPNLSKASIESFYAALTTEGGASANTITLSLTAVNKAFETSEGANDGSTSTEWQDLSTSTPWRTVLK